VLHSLKHVLQAFWDRNFKKQSPKEKLKQEEEEELIRDWNPEPLVEHTPDSEIPEEVTVDNMMKTHVSINGEDKLNLCSFNFLGLVGDDQMQAAALAACNKYGIGSCGPRGFYGTVDCHLQLEEKLAEFLGAEEAILYSYGFSTVASLIPAYCKRGDVIFYDKGVGFATQKGLEASRSRLVGFEHNDMADLESKLEAQAALDAKDQKKAKNTRRFLVVEGLYANYGDIAPLDKLVDLKFKYKVRLFLEESMSFGVLGKTGRGLTEHFGISVDKIDAIAASLETSLASVGGFVAGRRYVIDHQRLSGAGYCYSASLPPLLAVAAIEGLNIIDERKDLQSKLITNSRSFREAMAAELKKVKVESVQIAGGSDSPLVHLRLAGAERDESANVLAAVKKACMADGVAVTQAIYIVDEEMHPPEPSLRISISAGHSAAELKVAAKKVAAAFQAAL
jgi:serine palmitoyltransferase